MRMARAGVSLHTADLNGRTALHEAAKAGHVEVVQHLLDAGMDPLAKDRFCLPLSLCGLSVLLCLLLSVLFFFLFFVQLGPHPSLRGSTGRARRSCQVTGARQQTLC